MRITLKAMFQYAIVIFVIFAIVSACKKDDGDDTPAHDYVGTWVVTGNVTNDEVTFEMKDIMTFTEGTFTEIMQIKNPATSQWINYLGMKGTMTVNGKAMNINVNEAGISTIDPVSGVPSGTITYYKNNRNEFTQFMELLEMPATFQSEYEVSGNKLTFKTDYNADSDYNDEDEVSVYTRQ